MRWIELDFEDENECWDKNKDRIVNDVEHDDDERFRKILIRDVRFVKLRTLMNESKRFDWKKTCLFTNNALFDSKCFVSKIREIKNSIDFSWIFAFLILIVSIRIIWVCFVSLTILLLETRWESVNVRSSFENMTISLRLSFNETSCETTLNKMIICRFCFFICVIIVC